MLVEDPLDESGVRPDVEAPGDPDSDPANMRSDLFALRHDRLHEIPGRKPEMRLSPGQESSRESEGVEAGPLIRSPPRGLYFQDRTVPALDLVDISDAGGVFRVPLGDPEAGPVVLRPASGGDLDRKPGPLQCLIQGPPGAVDGRRVPEGTLRPGEDLRQQIWLLRQKLPDRAGALSFVAGTTGQGQVGNAVASALVPRADMVDLQGDVFHPAVRAFPAPLLQEVFPGLVSGQGALLIFRPGDFRVFDLLHVEPDQLLGNANDRNQSPDPVDPGNGRVDPVLQGRRKPALGSTPVVEPGLPVAEVRPSPSPEGPSSHEPVPDPSSPVMDLRLEQDMGGLLPGRFFLPDYGDAGGLRSGIYLDPDRLRFAPDPVF